MARVFDRGLSMFNPENFKEIKVGFIGAGGIGSISAYSLSKMGIKVKVCDFDTVEDVNTSSQFYGNKDIGKPKVEALKENLSLITDEDIEIVNGVYKKEDFEDCQILVLSLDNLTTRKQVIEDAKDDQFILDTRMIKKISQIFAFYGVQKDRWLIEERDENVDKTDDGTMCTEKAIAFNALGMGAMVGSLVVDFLQGKKLNWCTILDLSGYRIYNLE